MHTISCNTSLKESNWIQFSFIEHLICVKHFTEKFTCLYANDSQTEEPAGYCYWTNQDFVWARAIQDYGN